MEKLKVLTETPPQNAAVHGIENNKQPGTINRYNCFNQDYHLPVNGVQESDHDVQEPIIGAQGFVSRAQVPGSGAQESVHDVQESVNGAQELVRGAQELVNGVQETGREAQESVNGAQEPVNGAQELVHDVQEPVKGSQAFVSLAQEPACILQELVSRTPGPIHEEPEVVRILPVFIHLTVKPTREILGSNGLPLTASTNYNLSVLIYYSYLIKNV